MLASVSRRRLCAAKRWAGRPRRAHQPPAIYVRSLGSSPDLLGGGGNVLGSSLDQGDPGGLGSHARSHSEWAWHQRAVELP